MAKLHHACALARESLRLWIYAEDHWQYENTLKDYNFGTLVRKDASKLYGQDNCVLVTRVQFFAIEVSEFMISPWELGLIFGRLPEIERDSMTGCTSRLRPTKPKHLTMHWPATDRDHPLLSRSSRRRS